MDDHKSKIIARIHKLFALAASDSENEANEAAAKAQEMLLRYNISEDEISSYSSVKSEKVVRVVSGGKNLERRSTWYANLANIVADANLCKLLTSGPDLIWIGKPTNIEIAQYIFENLIRELTRICEIRWAVFNWEQAGKRYGKVHGKTWKHNFYLGANQAISARLTANLRQLKIDNTNLALITVNDQEIDAYMKANYPRLRSVPSNYSFERSAFDQGKQAGASVSFNRGVSSGGSLAPRMLNSGKK